MKIIGWLILLVVIVAAGVFFYTQQTAKANPAANSTQIILVLADNWTSQHGVLQRYARDTVNKPWQKVGESKAVNLGKNGLGWGIGLHGSYLTNDSIIVEGAKKSPAGVFALGPAFGKYTNKYVGIKMPYEQITQYTFCPDDPKSKSYNRIIDTYKVKPDWHSAENMNKYADDGFYTYGIMIQHNYAKTVGGSGSCFFIHVSPEANIPTAGCTAFDEKSVKEMLLWLNPKANPVLVQLPRDMYARFGKQWYLPIAS